jgi:RNA polymerase sigma-70 factor (ECF subfamily)
MTDTEIINLIKKDDPLGLSTAYQAFRKEFIHWMMRFSKCGEEDAREYYQGAILIVYDNVHAGKLDTLQCSLKTYLFGIGKNLVMQQFRESNRQNALKAEYFVQNYLHEDTEAYQAEVNLEIISRSFTKLGEPCHELLEQYYFKRKNMIQIASEMGYKNQETAKNQKYKCMERLRKMAFGNEALPSIDIEGEFGINVKI